MRYAVVFTPEAQEQLVAIYRHIAAAASPTIAERYVNAIIKYCEGLQTFPHRGTCRDDIRQGLRVSNYKNRVAIAFNVDVERVSILGVYYGGQNYEAAFQSDVD